MEEEDQTGGNDEQEDTYNGQEEYDDARLDALIEFGEDEQ